jgi:hypothetical protein
MGVCLSWIAVRGASPEQVNALLGVRASGNRADFYEADCTGTDLPSGFYLVMFRRKELTKSFLRRISGSLSLLYGFVEEHVMYSTVAAWEGGKELWAVVHDAQEGIMDLHVRGTPPDLYPAIRDRLWSEQEAEGGEDADVDFIFDIPLSLAHELTGYRYDQDGPGMQANGFEVLQGQRSGKWGLLQRLLGRDA